MAFPLFFIFIFTGIPKREEMPPKESKKNTTKEVASDDAAPPLKKRNTEVDIVVTKENSSTDLTRMSSRTPSRSAAVTEEDVLRGTTPFVRKYSDSDFKPQTMLKLISWNVAGLRALLKKDTNELQKLVTEQQPDILCLQETKLSDVAEGRNIGVLDGYTFVDSISTAKKGYSGTRTYVKKGLEGVTHCAGFDVLSGSHKDDEEGRVLTTFFDNGKLAVLNSYVPNSGMTLDRLDYRTATYDPMMRKLLKDLHKRLGAGNSGGSDKGLIWTGDLNVAERDYDRFFASNFRAMQKVPGFTPEERTSFRQTLTEVDMIDSFRFLYPNASKAYSFWSAKFQCRAKGNGWRLDYFVVSQCLAKRVVDSFMLPAYVSSDHCPIVLWLLRK